MTDSPEQGRPVTSRCEFWQKRMFARFVERGMSHVTCGRPWAEHGELGECPTPGMHTDLKTRT